MSNDLCMSFDQAMVENRSFILNTTQKDINKKIVGVHKLKTELYS